jgi:hypothetical protein
MPARAEDENFRRGGIVRLYRAVVLFVLVLVTWMAFAQDKPKLALKTEVALELRNAQWDSAKLALQMKQLESQYQALQAQSQTVGKALSEKMATALERSGIDTKKYELNADTLEVTPKLVVPETKKP